MSSDSMVYSGYIVKKTMDSVHRSRFQLIRLDSL